MRQCPPHWVVSSWVIVICTTLAAATASAQLAWPAPRIDRVAPDRVDRGDEITITGDHLGDSTDEVVVNLEPGLHISISGASPTTIRLAIPDTAVTGPLTVTVRRRLDNGAWEEQTSNRWFLMVIWGHARFRDWSISGWVEAAIPGESDAIYLVQNASTYLYQRINVWRVKGYRELVRVTGIENFTPNLGYYVTATTRAERTSGSTFALFNAYGDPDVDPDCMGLECDVVEVRRFPDGEPLLSTRVRYCPDPFPFYCPLDYRITGFELDGRGNIVVFAELDATTTWVEEAPGRWRPVALTPRLYNLWRIPLGGLAGQVLDLTHFPPLLPSPQVIVNDLGRAHSGNSSLAVSGDGTILARWAQEGLGEQHFHLIPPPGVPGEPVTDQLPIPRCIDCNPSDSDSHYITRSVTADCMGRFYVATVRRNTGSTGSNVFTWPIYAVSPTAAGWWETTLLADGVYQPGNPTGPPPSTAWLTTDGRGNLYEGSTSAVHRFAPRELTDPGYYDDFLCGEARLALRVEGLEDQPIDEDGRRVTVALGQRRKLTAVWLDESGGQQTVPVTWELLDPDPRWEGEHPEPDGLSRVLFPRDVMLLFDEGRPNEPAENRLVWPSHTGRVTVKLRLAAEDSPDNAPHGRSVSFVVTYDGVPLGSSPAEYDASINKWANAFGFPPQYIKGMIEQESQFQPLAYRYEPRKWDFGQGELTKVISLVERGDAYAAPFQFLEPQDSGIGAHPQGSNLTQSDKDGRAHSFNRLYTWEGDPPACQEVGPGRGDVRVWALYLGSNGVSFPGDDPRNRLANCPQRMNWDTGIDLYHFDTLTSAPPEHEAAWFFFTHPYYVGQMFLAASYGLTQVGYHMAVRSMDWRSAAPGLRDWANVTDRDNYTSNNNIYLGARWLVSQEGEYRQLRERARHSRTAFDLLMTRLLRDYNRGSEYAGLVLGRAANFLPTFQPVVEGQ